MHKISIRKQVIAFLFVIIGLLSAPILSYGQSARDVNVSEMTDTQIDKIIAEMGKRNLSLDQAKQLARMKGATEAQIAEMEQRIISAQQDGQKEGSNARIVELVSEELSERQDDAKEKRDTRIFGVSYFNKKGLTFAANVNAEVTEDYVLGPGDELSIDIYGSSQHSYNVIVGRAGNIDINLVGPIYVAGQSLSTAKQTITSKLKTLYSDLGDRTSASIKLGKLRTMNINVLGETYSPGTYTVSGSTSLFNLLYICGGPNSKGSFRDIQVIRSGKIIHHLDVYDFLINGNSNINVPLKDADIVYIPMYKKRIVVEGAFRHTGFFEAKDGETSDDIIRYAGGLESNAMQNNIELTRISPRGSVFQSIKIGDGIDLADGDVIQVSRYDGDRTYGQVSIAGGVFEPGNFEFREGMKLSELVKLAGGLKENAFLNRGLVTRLKEDRSLESFHFSVAELSAGTYDVELKDGDAAFITTNEGLKYTPTVTIHGQVRNPHTLEYRENLTLGDAIVMSGGLTDIATPHRIEVYRRLDPATRDTSKVTSRIVKILEIDKDLSINIKDNDFILEPMDIVSVRSYPNAKIHGTISISGEVEFPGNYTITSTNETITSLIARAGGMTNLADIDGARLYRRINIDSKLKQIFKESQSAINEDEDINIRMDTQNHFELIAIELRDILNNPKKYADLHLQDDDELIIPKKAEIVEINGQVLNAISLSYIDGMSAKEYVNLAGGFAPSAYKSKVFVVYPNGKAKATKRFLWFKHYPKVVPGSKIIVPEKVKRERLGAPAVISMSSSVVAMMAIIVNIMNNSK